MRQVDSFAGTTSFFRSASSWSVRTESSRLTAHCGWMPPLEYVRTPQTGQILPLGCDTNGIGFFSLIADTSSPALPDFHYERDSATSYNASDDAQAKRQYQIRVWGDAEKRSAPVSFPATCRYLTAASDGKHKLEEKKKLGATFPYAKAPSYRTPVAESTEAMKNFGFPASGLSGSKTLRLLVSGASYVSRASIQPAEGRITGQFG
jgi:hypothetical protein